MLKKSDSPLSVILQRIPNQHLRIALRVLVLCRPFSACHKKVEKVEKPTQNRPPSFEFRGREKCKQEIDGKSTYRLQGSGAITSCDR